MGVHGFTSYVDSNQHFLQDHRFHDSKIVIDGNNLYYFLYYYCHVRYQFGGDYDQYFRKVIEIFQTLKACNIEPFVVFDGGYEADGRKLRTVIYRAEERIHLAGLIVNGKRGKVLPVLAYETFKMALDFIGVPHATCDFEADSQLVTLANLWNCPILSNDSDFFIFNLKAGLIILDYVDFRITYGEDEETHTRFPYIPTQLFHIEHFVNSVKGVNKSCMPLFATLVGNDLVDARVFEPFFSQLKYCQKYKKKKLTSNKFSKMVAILNWLKHNNNITDAIESVLAHFNSEHRNRVLKIITRSVDSYADPEVFDSFDLQKYFEGDSRAEAALNNEHCKAYNRTSLPVWFVQSLRCGDHCGFYIQNSVVLHRVIQQTQVEDLRNPSTYIMSERIRKVMYGILLKEDLTSLKDERPTLKAQTVEEYVRKCKHFVKTPVTPIMKLPEYGSLPGLSDVPCCSLTRRRQIVMESVSVSADFVNLFSRDLQLFMEAVIFWLNNSKPNITRHHLDAVLVCIIFLHAKAKLQHSCSGQQTAGLSLLHTNQGNDEDSSVSDVSQSAGQLSVSESCDVATEKELGMVCSNLCKHHRDMQKVTNTNPIEPEITHGFAQLQACVLDVIHLNHVLQYPFSKPALPKLMNCTFLYNFCRDLRSRVDSNHCIQGMLIRDSPLADLFTKMQAAILGAVSSEVFRDSVGKIKKTARKRDKKKEKTVPASETVDDDSENSNTENMFDVIANCDLNNKFSALLLDNDDY